MGVYDLVIGEEGSLKETVCQTGRCNKCLGKEDFLTPFPIIGPQFPHL